MHTEDKFWLVWQPESGPARFKHHDQRTALAEAERLAIANPGKKFYVCEAQEGFVVNPVQRIALTTPVAF